MKQLYIFILAFVSFSTTFSQTFTLTSALSGTTISTCSGTFIDDGGTGSYTNGQTRTITFCPATPGDVIKVTFTQLKLRAAGGGGCQDILDVYQGNAAYAAPLITANTPDDRYCGDNSAALPTITSTSPNGCITFRFFADGNQNDDGWSATISCVTPCRNPTAALSNTTILNICGPSSNNPGSLNVGFDGSGSSLGVYGPGGSTVTLTQYNWIFGDGTQATTSSPTTSHTYPSVPGVYVARLSVRDNNLDVSTTGCGSTNSTTRIIRVLPSPTFTATTNSPQNLGCGSNATLTGVARSRTEAQGPPAVSGVTVALPDGTGGAFTSSADFSGLFPSGATVTSGCYPILYFNLEHSWAGDLWIDLIAPTGQTVRVFNRHGVGGMFGPIYKFGSCVNGLDNGVPGCGATYSVVNSGGQSWTNYGNAAITTTVSSPCAGFAGPCEAASTTQPYYTPTVYNSTNSFAAFNGADLNGVWQIRITDNLNLDDGFLFSWGLVFPTSCYNSLESVTPSLVSATWTNGGAGPAVPGAQSTTTLAVTDPGPDACPVAGTCTGNQLTNTINFGPFNTPGTYPYIYNVTDQFGCNYTHTVNVAVSCACPSLTALSYAAPFCRSITAPQTPSVSGSGAISAGVYSATPSGLSLNASTGEINPSLSTPNTYTVTYLVTPSAGTCTPISINTVVTIVANPTVAVSNATTCAGIPVNLTASGATTYTWSNGTNGSSISITPAVSSTLSVTGETNGCTDTKTLSVTVNPNPTLVVLDDVICAGETTTLSASGATTYSWTTGATTSSIVVTPSVSTAYTLTGTTNGCTDTRVVTVVVVANPTVAVSNSSICIGSTTTITASGATNYTWTTGDFTPSIVQSPTVNTTYTVTGESGGCIDTKTVSLTIVPNPTVAVTNTTICNGQSVVLSATGATTYSWNTGATTSTVSVSPTSLTIYTVTGTTSGCSNTRTVSVTVTANPTVAVTNTTICNGQSVVLTAGGATTYSWNTGATTSTVSVSPTSLTIYTVTGTTSGCTDTKTVSVTVTPNPTVAVTNTTICNGQNVVLTAGGATTYSWNTGATTSTVSVSPTSLTIYTVTGTTSDCSNTRTVSVTVTANPTVAVTNTTICNGQSVVLTAGGATTYSWNTGATTSTVSVSPTSLTIYTVTGTTSGCSDTKTVSVTVTPNPTVAVTNTTICNGQSVVLSAGGASTYSWSTGATTSTVSVSPTTLTIYTVTGTTSGCSDTKTVSVTVNAIPTTTASSTGSLSCTTLTVGLNSTLAGANYTWTAPAGGSVTNANLQNASTSGSGTYTLFVSSAAGCTFSTTTSVTQNTVAPTGVSAGSSATLVCGSPSVALNGSVSTPTNATVLWTGANVCGTSTNLSSAACGAGVYTLTATNPLNGCTASSTVQISPSAGSPSVTQNPVTNTITCTNTLVTVSISTTVTPVTYNWAGTGISSATNGATITVTQGGTFTYTVLNTGNNCETSGSIIVAQNTAAPTTTAASSGTLTCSTNTVALTSTLAGMNYTWTAPSGGSVSSANTQSTTASGTSGNYSLTVVNPVNGCVFNTTTSVSQNTVAPTTVASTTGTLTCVVSSVDLNSTTAGMNYTWTAPAGGSVTSVNTQSTSASGQGTYSLTIIDPSNGCSFATTTSLTQNTVAPSGVTAGSNQTLTCTSPSVTVIGSVTSPTNVNVSWAGIDVCGASNSYTTQLCAAGIYTLTATDPSNGCTSSSTVQISPNAGAPTPSISASALVIDCNNASQTVTVTATPNNDLTYSWNNTPASTNADGSLATFTNANTFICTVTNTLNGCSNTTQVIVTTNTVIPSTIASVSGTLTCVVSSVNLDVTLAGMNYTWTAPASGSVGSANTQSTSVTGSGVYSVSIIDPANGCSFNTTVSVTENTVAPAGVNAGSSQTLSCTSPSIALSGSVTSPTNAIISWTGSNVCGSSNTLNTDVCAAGVYTLTATDASNGCVTTSTVEVFANPGAPVLGITSSSLTIDCNNATQSATVTSTPNTDVTYSWNNAPTSTSSNGSEATFSSPNTYVCTVTNTLSGCSNQVQVIVVTNTAVPVITISPSQTLTCSTPTAAIETTVTPSGTYSYTWTGSGVSGVNTATVEVNSADIYTVVVMDFANGCTNIATSDVSVDANLPVVVINATSSNTLISCISNSVTLTATVTPTDSYTYVWSSGGITDTEVITIAGIYTVVVTNTITGCVSTATFEVISNTSAPNLTATNAIIPCTSPTVALLASSTNTAVTYSWTTSNGTIDSGSNTTNPVVSAAGNYVVTATNTENGCTSTATVTVSQTTVNAAFTANPTSGVAPLDVQFTNQSTGATTYNWTFGNGNTSSGTNPNNVFTLPGTYTVTLVASDGACTSTATLTIQVDDNSLIIVPNVFTPNGDGSNDVFKIKTIGIKDLSCDIFNRWGTKVFTLSSVNDKWDGSGVNDGTYFFILNAKGFDGKEYKEQGYITLYR